MSHCILGFSDIGNESGCFGDDLGCGLGDVSFGVEGVIIGLGSNDGGNECGDLFELVSQLATVASWRLDF